MLSSHNEEHECEYDREERGEERSHTIAAVEGAVRTLVGPAHLAHRQDVQRCRVKRPEK